MFTSRFLQLVLKLIDQGSLVDLSSWEAWWGFLCMQKPDLFVFSYTGFFLPRKFWRWLTIALAVWHFTHVCVCSSLRKAITARWNIHRVPRTLSAAPSSPEWGCRLRLRSVLSCDTTSMTCRESGARCHLGFNDIHIKEIQGPVRSLYPLCPLCKPSGKSTVWYAEPCWKMYGGNKGMHRRGI